MNTWLSRVYKVWTPSCTVVFTVFADDKPFQMQIVNPGVKTRATGNPPLTSRK